MSILSLTRTRNVEQPRPEPAIPYAPRPKPAPLGPHQLGNHTLANVETLTNMSADEIEKLADKVDEAAHETSDGLRQFAHKLRATGRIANSELAAFVTVASTCAEAGKHMQDAIARRNEPQPEPDDTPAEPKVDPASEQTTPVPDLDAIGQAIAEVAEAR